MPCSLGCAGCEVQHRVTAPCHRVPSACPLFSGVRSPQCGPRGAPGAAGTRGRGSLSPRYIPRVSHQANCCSSDFFLFSFLPLNQSANQPFIFLLFYVLQLDQISISFDGGKTTMNFIEAALVIQGSACIYSRKVSAPGARPRPRPGPGPPAGAPGGLLWGAALEFGRLECNNDQGVQVIY